jgi:hypothetical protein
MPVAHSHSSTASGCLTEVHHVNGEGKDAGVVYSEMQGRQNQSGDLMELARQRLMFPEGCGYRSETGGLMEALRVLDVRTIREYSAFNKPNKGTMHTTMSRRICLLLLLGMSIMVRFYRLYRIK